MTTCGDEADVLDPDRTEAIHRFHDGAVFRVLVALDEDNLFPLVLERGLHSRRKLRFRELQAVHPELVRGIDRHDRLILGIRFGLGVSGLGQGDFHALLQHRRDEHHDDQQHQHDVDERRDVDIWL